MESWFAVTDASDQSPLVLYISIFFALVGGAVGLPIPEDIPLITAGVLAQLGRGRLDIYFIVCYTAIILGDLIIYAIGRKLGPRIFEIKYFKSKLPPERIDRIKESLEKRSLLMIFIARHLFYLRTATFLTCGAVKMKLQRFLLADLLAALISAPVMMGIGYLATEHIDDIQNLLGKANTIILIAIVIALALFIYIRKQKNNS